MNKSSKTEVKITKGKNESNTGDITLYTQKKKKNIKRTSDYSKFIDEYYNEYLNISPISIAHYYNEQKKLYKKRPYFSDGWRNFTKEMAMDEAEKRYNGKTLSGFVMPTGQNENNRYGGLTILDIDDCEEWDKFKKDHNIEDPDTVIAKSGNNGLHYYFKYCPDISNNTNIFDPDYSGIDIRNDGGCIILPGTRYRNIETGGINKYKWIKGKKLFDKEPSEFPEKIKDLIKKYKNKTNNPQKNKQNNKNNNKNNKNNKKNENDQNDQKGIKYKKIIKATGFDAPIIKDIVDLIPLKCCGNYSDWCSIGMAIKNCHKNNNHDQLFDVFDAFSSKHEKYDGREATKKKWDSFNDHKRGCGFGTLISYAKEGNEVKAKQIVKNLIYQECGDEFENFEENYKDYGVKPINYMTTEEFEKFVDLLSVDWLKQDHETFANTNFKKFLTYCKSLGMNELAKNITIKHNLNKKMYNYVMKTKIDCCVSLSTLLNSPKTKAMQDFINDLDDREVTLETNERLEPFTISKDAKENGVTIIKENKKYLSDLNVDGYQTIFVKAGLGSGKTTQAIKIIKQLKEQGHKTFRFSAPRIALTAQLREKLNENDPDFVKYYIDEKNDNDLFSIDSLVQSPESFNTLMRNGAVKIVDVVLIDELSAFINHLINSSTIRNRAHIYEVFEMLVAKCKIIICLDGNMSRENWKYIRSLREDKETLIVHNTYKNDNGMTYHIIKTEEELCTQMNNRLKENKKFALGSDSKKVTKKVNKIFTTDFPDKKFLLYNAENTDESKKDLQHCNERWADKVDAVIYSPLVLYGTDFSIENCYDEYYGIYNKKTLIPQLIYQQAKRIRNVASKKAFIHISGLNDFHFVGLEPGDYKSVSYNGIVKEIDKEINMNGELSIYLKTYDKVEGKVILDKNASFLENMIHYRKKKNKAHNNFLGQFVLYFTEWGGKVVKTVSFDNYKTTNKKEQDVNNDQMKTRISQVSKEIDESDIKNIVKYQNYGKNKNKKNKVKSDTVNKDENNDKDKNSEIKSDNSDNDEKNTDNINENIDESKDNDKDKNSEIESGGSDKDTDDNNENRNDNEDDNKNANNNENKDKNNNENKDKNNNDENNKNDSEEDNSEDDDKNINIEYFHEEAFYYKKILGVEILDEDILRNVSKNKLSDIAKCHLFFAPVEKRNDYLKKKESEDFSGPTRKCLRRFVCLKNLFHVLGLKKGIFQLKDIKVNTTKNNLTEEQKKYLERYGDAIIQCYGKIFYRDITSQSKMYALLDKMINRVFGGFVQVTKSERKRQKNTYYVMYNIDPSNLCEILYNKFGHTIHKNIKIFLQINKKNNTTFKKNHNFETYEDLLKKEWRNGCVFENWVE